MNYNCEPKLPNNVCADNIFVKVKNFPPSTPIQATLPSTPNKIIKVPVKVAIINVTEPLRDTIYIAEGFEDIKHIKRRVTLTQCHVTDKFLYIEGYISKNVGYAVPCGNEEYKSDSHCKVIKNDYKDLTAKLNFHMTVPVVLTGDIKPSDATVENGSYFVDCMKPCDSGVIGELPCEKYYKQTVVLNEGFKCELEEYSISESVILKKESCETEWQYDTIVEKLELSLSIAILQNQQIQVATTQ